MRHGRQIFAISPFGVRTLYNNAAEASAETGVPTRMIYKVLNRERYHSHGWRFTYAEERFRCEEGAMRPPENKHKYMEMPIIASNFVTGEVLRYNNLSQMCDELHLNRRNVWAILQGNTTRKHIREWSFSYDYEEFE